MTTFDYAKIRNELEQLRKLQDKGGRKSAVFDFGLFILLYFCALVLIVTGMLAVGVPLHRYTVFFAVPLAWLGLALSNRAPLKALIVSVAGVLFLAAVSVLVSRFFDTGLSSSSVQKASAGLLASGWNPFTQTMSAFANSTDILPYNSTWLSSQIDSQPKAAVMIGAAFTAFTGNIAYGKVFNIAGMAAAVCVLGPMIRNTFKTSGFAAFAAALLAAANPVTLSQAFSYSADGFLFQLLTIAAGSFACLAYKPEGKLANAAKAAAFAAVCLAVNISINALLYCGVICLLYFLARVITIARSEAPGYTRTQQQLDLLFYLLAMAIAAVFVLGAATYVVNFLRYGNPLYGLYGAPSVNTVLEAQMTPAASGLPLAAQVLVSLFSPMSNAVFSAAALKIPFTFTASELNLAATEAVTGGWGIVFSGIFCLSLLILLGSLIVTIKRRSNSGWLIAALLIAVALPVFFIRYLFAARLYLQLFWLPLAALVCLFSAAENKRRELRTLTKRLIGAVLCLLLLFNCVTAYNTLTDQYHSTQDSRAAIETLIGETESGGKTADIAPMTRGLYYGLLFNLRDEGLEAYNFVENIPEDEIGGNVLSSLLYRLRGAGDAETAETNSFLASLYRSGYIVVIAKQGACGALTEDMLSLLAATGLDAGSHNSLTETYLAVLGSDAEILAEESAAGSVSAEVTADDLQITVQSSPSAAYCIIGGREYALERAGYNVVVFDAENRTLVDSVVINTEVSPVLSR